MAIHKETPANLRTFGDTYAVIPSSTIEMLTNPDALAMLVWLLDRPQDWVVRREHLRTRFGLGRTRYDSAMKDLKDAGLAWWHEERDPGTGRIIDRVLNVGAIPLESVLPKVGKPTSRENPQVGKPLRSVNPPGGKSDHLHITNNLHITDKLHITEALSQEKPKSKRFKPPTIDQIREYIQEKGYSVNAERFHAYYESNGWMVGRTKMKSWKAALTNWNTREQSNGKNQQNTDNGRKLSGAERTRIAREEQRQRELARGDTL